MAMEGYRGFLGLLVSALLVGFLSVIFVLVWVLHYREGLGWDGGALEFNWHPVLAVTGFVFIQGIAYPRFFHLSAAMGSAFSPGGHHAHTCVFWTPPLCSCDCDSPYGSDGEAVFCPEKPFLPFIPARGCFYKCPGPSDSDIWGSHLLDCYQTTMETSHRTRVYPPSAKWRRRWNGRCYSNKLRSQPRCSRYRAKQRGNSQKKNSRS
ncbi:plasma membrane ascorbate-dependent reductase CYBRD1 isoform X2 [Peromyscus maniculatus bairdii]|uniref:plasma membrane ascorbate-dependent reductase CYBRD1 isoform X2 n=1 Tax=Peromyscus maniculatus bairdii TaxID=230844 RepID=UPI00042A9F25|nr:uncharacterized protein LOC102928772 isoform X2 [Peromyscus maniculatus bairdii]